MAAEQRTKPYHCSYNHGAVITVLLLRLEQLYSVQLQRGAPAEFSQGHMQAQDGEQSDLNVLWFKERGQTCVEEKGEKSEAELACLILLTEEAKSPLFATLTCCIGSCLDHQLPCTCDCSQVHFCCMKLVHQSVFRCQLSISWALLPKSGREEL